MADIGLDSTSDESFAISIDDTSPTVLYEPFGDTYGVPNLTGGWNPYFSGSGLATDPATDPAAGQKGEGTSFHVTSADGASLGLRWNGECTEHRSLQAAFTASCITEDMTRRALCLIPQRAMHVPQCLKYTLEYCNHH